jgi:hypothetical protein
MPDSRVRAAGLAAAVMALASVVMAPLNALARMRTESGRSDFENELAHWWAAPAMDLAEPLLDFGSPQTVYLAYGRFYVVAMAAVLACAVAVHSRRPSQLRRPERWGWRITLPAYAVMTACFAGYWISAPDAVLDVMYLILMFAMLCSMIGHVLLGIGLIRNGFRPRLTGWVIVTEPLTAIALVSMSTQALGMWPMMLAWGVAGWSLWRSGARTVVPQAAAA